MRPDRWTWHWDRTDAEGVPIELSITRWRRGSFLTVYRYTLHLPNQRTPEDTLTFFCAYVADDVAITIKFPAWLTDRLGLATSYRPQEKP